jgi:hemin uptake protein HemP
MNDDALQQPDWTPRTAACQSTGMAFQRASRLTTSEALFAGCRELLIEHAGSLYRMRVTQQNKLILTK